MAPALSVRLWHPMLIRTGPSRSTVQRMSCPARTSRYVTAAAPRWLPTG
ncbi:hypothetical protein I553_0603 [Mycobacterium xenopi 4042]|uniref:Uncharacterized protein n=1 Tax=Mycobacterium xenopi 4042 TaxID=1299334 RepID=X7YJ13_MYCXE|nr:hypothetical protein I553_0603 [Mycobacterium xenopi 4042]